MILETKYKIILLVLILPMKIFAQGTLEKGFKTPPASASARTWWHWLNGNVSRQGITADLEAMKLVGIKEAQIFNVDAGFPEGSATYLSTEWLNDFHFAATEAKRLGIELGFNNGAGWSNSGGPWVLPENAMQSVVFTEKKILEGELFDHHLPAPTVKIGVYKDIAVFAFPTPKNSTRIPDLYLKAQTGEYFRRNLEPDTSRIPNDAAIVPKDIRNLTSKLSQNGTLNWTPPKGNWTVIRFGYAPMGTKNRPAVVGGSGLECDKMNKIAVDAYWRDGVMPILNRLGDLAGTVVKNCVLDSYEVGCDNWTAGFEDEFRKRRGYDCLKYLPALAGYYITSGEVTERFLWDFRKTQSDLITDNYYGRMAELCHQNKLNFFVEPYGGPYDAQRAGEHGDLIMGEFWLSKKIFLESPRLAASLSHLKGNAITGAEAFTSFGGWKDHPATMKPVGDKVWAEGINRFVFHTYVHQPWNIAPGLSFGPYGIEMDRMNTWWKQSKGYMDYVARSQYLLQQGKSHADFLVFSGESAPNYGILRTDLKLKGYDYDQIGPELVQDLSVRDGKLYTSQSGPYAALLLPESMWASPQLLQKIEVLVNSGALVLGPSPLRSPSLTDYPNCDTEVHSLVSRLWPYKIKSITSTDEIVKILNENKLLPDFSIFKNGNDIRFIHRSVGSDDIYFVANSLNQSRNLIANFRVVGKTPELWNAETGEITELPIWNEKPNGVTEIPLHMAPYGSFFVVFKKTANPKAHFLSIKNELAPVKPSKIGELKIIKAEYGSFLPEGLTDVTGPMIEKVAKKDFNFNANNSFPVDPAPGVMKELRLEYTLDGRSRLLSLLEGEQRTLNVGTSTFKVIRALYGKFPADFKSTPILSPAVDVTQKVNSKVVDNTLCLSVDNSLFEEGKNFSPNSKLKISYTIKGDFFEQLIDQGNELIIGNVPNNLKFQTSPNGTHWIVGSAKDLTLMNAEGKAIIISPTSVQKVVNLSDNWMVKFNEGKPTEEAATFKTLSSWSNSDKQTIRYFSGTAIYKKAINIPASFLTNDRNLVLDLGEVKEIAEVKINGKVLGIQWMPPFTVDVTAYLKPGKNTIEISVTNLWPNKLIGDERLANDGISKKYDKLIWPDWLLDDSKARNSGRITFNPYGHYTKDSPLLPSGLLGPVLLRSSEMVKLK